MILLAFSVMAQKKNLTKTITYELSSDGTLTFEGTGVLEYRYIFKKLAKQVKKNPVKKIVIGEGITDLGSFVFCYYRNNEPIKLVLPQSVKKIDSYCFSSTPVEVDLNYPVTLGMGAFENAIIANRFELPANTVVEHEAFGRCTIDTLIVNEGCLLYSGCFDPFHYSYGKGNQSIKYIRFNGNKPSIIGEKSYNKYSYLALGGLTALKEVYVEDDNSVDLSILRAQIPKDCIVSTPDSRLRAHGVTSYINGVVPTWEDYLRAKMRDIPSPQRAKADIQAKVEEWQKKGEFEPTQQWQKRVTEKSRNAMVKKLTEEYNELVESTVEKTKKDYADWRRKAADAYYKDLIDAAQKDVKKQTMQLHPYDADNQTYMITSPTLGDILLPVPLKDAAYFKNNWGEISRSADFEFAPKTETEVGVSKVTFYGKYPTKYVYDGKAKVNYTVTEVNYNFSPMLISDYDLASVSIADVEAPIAGTTVTTAGALAAKNVDVQRRTIDAGKGKGSTAPTQPAATAATAKVQSAIDSNIPVGKGSPRTNTFALVIANENYTRTEPVPYAVRDGKVLRDYLTTTLCIPEKNIFTVTDATLNDIRYNLRRVGDVCRAYDGEGELIVYYAGHGVPDDNTRDAYLLPVDGYPDDAKSGLSLASLTEELASLPTRRSVLLIDACFSGSGREGNALTSSRGVRIKAKPTAGRGNLIVFSASQGIETAQPLHSEGHGMFTYYLIKKLNETRGNVTMGELSDYVINNVKRASALEGKMQTPTVSAAADNNSWKTQNF